MVTILISWLATVNNPNMLAQRRDNNHNMGEGAQQLSESNQTVVNFSATVQQNLYQ